MTLNLLTHFIKKNKKNVIGNIFDNTKKDRKYQDVITINVVIENNVLNQTFSTLNLRRDANSTITNILKCLCCLLIKFKYVGNCYLIGL